MSSLIILVVKKLNQLKISYDGEMFSQKPNRETYLEGANETNKMLINPLDMNF